jgi:hypothetical protein
MRPRTALEAASIRRSQPLPHIGDRDRCVNAIRFACEGQPLQIWIGLLSFPFLSFPLLAIAFHLCGKNFAIAFFSHILTHSHPLIYLRIIFFSTLKTNQGMCVCMCVCVVYVCVHSAIWIAVSSDTQIPDSILSYAVHLGFTLSARVLHFGYWRDGNWGLRFPEAI